jgi:8-oxo-dGTP pyrophosphatase MutT (NUDIX family)
MDFFLHRHLSAQRQRQPVKQEVLLRTQWFTVVSETRDTEKDPYYILDCPDGVVVIASTTDGNVILVQQYRPTLGADSLELPGGYFAFDGEAPEGAARRELLEETGFTATEIALLGVIAPDVGRLRYRLWCFFASAVARHQDPPEATPEIGGVRSVPPGTLIEMCRDGRLRQSLDLAAIWLAVLQKRLPCSLV